MKKALLLVAVDPTITGVLIKGPKGVAKSTAVRALASLLPEIEVVADCPFSCDPDHRDRMCNRCRARLDQGESLPRSRRRMRIVELPVSATLDRVVGTLDIKKVLKEGERGLEPGLLALANRGILYIDEVNLLPDEVVNAILDSAASKFNVVEREGVSVIHPADFILIGTMNPEEGELRPQLLDRFAISVEAESPRSPEELIEIAKRVEEFERNPEEFTSKFREQEAEIREKILKAKENLPKVRVPDELMHYLAQEILSQSQSTRAMIAATKVAKALAALSGRTEVDQEDVKEALEFVLHHRVKERRAPPQTSHLPRNQGEAQNHGNRDSTYTGNEKRKNAQEPESNLSANMDLPKIKSPGTGFGKGGVFDIITGKFAGSGIHLDLHSSLVNMALDRRTRLHPDDLVMKNAETQGAVPILLLLDTSRSMDFSRRILVAKAILRGLIQRAYQVRSRVGLITFSGSEARYDVPLTRNLRRVEEFVDNVTPSGKTPMSMALSLALNVVNRERRTRRKLTPLVFLISDGKANVSLYGNVLQELEYFSARLGEISKFVVIDTGNPYHPSFNSMLAERSHGVLLRGSDFVKSAL
ncbi:hypothetical protein L3N51_00335 [Metallosphaera sp. J1]|nr:hypothetical protein [Metallosphaera javensis (ex Hofmann et al. 2022)]